jgi:hypothetical protein
MGGLRRRLTACIIVTLHSTVFVGQHPAHMTNNSPRPFVPNLEYCLSTPTKVPSEECICRWRRALLVEPRHNTCTVCFGRQPVFLVICQYCLHHIVGCKTQYLTNHEVNLFTGSWHLHARPINSVITQTLVRLHTTDPIATLMV